MSREDAIDTHPAYGRRSILFVPGNRRDRFDKALASGADLICLDLEDGVSLSAKAEATNTVIGFLNEAGPVAAVRINALTTRDGLNDLLALSDMAAPPLALLIPKLRSPATLEIVAGAFDGACPRVIALIEDPEGLANALDIARSPYCAGLLFGGADFAAAIGAQMCWDTLLSPRIALVLAGRRAGIPVYDVPALETRDMTAVAEECRRVRTLGFSGKAAIHPSQIAAIHGAFAPSTSALSNARDALAAFRAGGGGAIQFNGKLVDEPVARQFAQTLHEAGEIDA